MPFCVVRRSMLPSLVLVGLVCSACSGDHPTGATEPRISDSATLVAVHEYSDGTIKEYELDGVTFFGDIPVADYQFALRVIEPLYVEGEVLMSVSNSRVFPPSQINGLTGPANGFALRTCTSESLADCHDGHLYVFSPTLDGFGLNPVISWHRFGG